MRTPLCDGTCSALYTTMSNIYNLEPPTKGKVLLKTSLGDLEIELWPKEAPKACRNFVQLCLEGYYDGTIFHRVIKDYLIQGGDPTGTGQGGETIYGGMFKDEFHSRLKFTHRGLVACANQNVPDTNGSQFFITLEKTDWLNKKNTIFGKVVGDTIYNLLRFNDLEVDEDDRPVDAPEIKEIEVLWNPFEDLVPRRSARQEREEQEAHRAALASAKRKAHAATSQKNLGLLSFGEEAEEEEAGLAAALVATKIRSAHDILQDDRLAREEETPIEERITIEPPAKRARQQPDKHKPMPSDAEHVPVKHDQHGDDLEQPSASGKEFGASMLAKMAEKRRQMGDGRKKAAAAAVTEPAQAPQAVEGKQMRHEAVMPRAGSSSESDDESAGHKQPGHARTYGRVRVTSQVADADLLKPWELQRQKYKQRKQQLGDREKDTLAKLKKFSSTLQASSLQAPSKETPQQDAAQAKDTLVHARKHAFGYDGKVDDGLDHRTYMPAAWRVDDYLEDDSMDVSLDDLRNHVFVFSKDSSRADTMQRRDDVDDYVVHDPLLEKGKGKWSKAAASEKKRATEWGNRSKPRH